MEPTRERWYRRRIAELERQLRERDERIAVLERQVAQLAEQVARLSKNSSNSSKPPSSDIVKPPKPPAPKGKHGKRRRKIGGQPGHPKHEREPFGPDQVNRVRTYALNACPACGGRLKPLKGAARVIQQVEILERPIRITEHRGLRYPNAKAGTHSMLPAVVPCRMAIHTPDSAPRDQALRGSSHSSHTAGRRTVPAPDAAGDC